MADKYYRYKSDCDGINLDDDDLYDHVLERERYHQLSHQNPRCMKHAFDVKEYDMKEHFGNLSTTKSILYGALILIVVFIIVYYLFFRNSTGYSSY